MKKGGCALIFFALFWSAITLTFDGFIGRSVIKSLLAQNFASTSGTIISSEVTQHRGSKSTTYGVKITYSYRVDGQVYTGDRFRYDNSSSSDSAWAHTAVANHPVGSSVKVFYDPHDPNESVLSPGIAGSDLFMMLFMTPFNAVMIGLWWAGLSQFWQRWRKPIAGGVRIRVGLQSTIVRLEQYSPLVAGLAGTAVLAFISMFVVAFGFGGFHPSIKVAGGTWFVVLAGGFAIAFWQWRKIASGKFDLVIDEASDTVQLPLNFGRKTEQLIPRTEIQSVSVETVLKRGSKGGTTTYYAPTLHLSRPAEATEKLAEWLDAERAESFANWLRDKLRLSDSGTAAAEIFPAPMRPAR